MIQEITKGIKVKSIQNSFRIPILQGVVIEILEVDKEPSDKWMSKYYGMKKDNKMYVSMRMPLKVRRIVIQLKDSEDYVVIPEGKFLRDTLTLVE